MKLYLLLVCIMWIAVIAWSYIRPHETIVISAAPIDILLKEEQPHEEKRNQISKAKQRPDDQETKTLPSKQPKLNDNGASSRWQLQPKKPDDERLLLRHFFSKGALVIDLKTKQVYSVEKHQLHLVDKTLDLISNQYRAFSVDSTILKSVLKEQQLPSQYWVLLPRKLAANIYPSHMTVNAKRLVVEYEAAMQGITFTIVDARNATGISSDLIGRQWVLN